MPANRESVNRELYGLLKNRGYKPYSYLSSGQSATVPEEADFFQFDFVKDGENYGKVTITIDGLHRMKVYYSEEVSDSPKASSHESISFNDLRKELRNFAKRRNLGFELEDEDSLEPDMAKREHNKKEGLTEGYYPMGKMKSYSDNVPSTKIIIQHSRQIEEGEQRFRNIAKIFVENTNGERFLLPTTKPGLARVYARHIAEGGTPYDERGQHITSLCEEYQKMAGFVRATKNQQFNESAQKLINEGINHYNNLREALHKMAGKKGYKEYFDNYKPALLEDDMGNDLSEMFTQTSLDPRIESVMPILNKLSKNLSEETVKEVDELAEWADSIIEDGTGTQVDENLRKWFKEKWVRFGPDGKIRGSCARGDDSEGKPKCLPQAKAHALGKKGRKYAASKKRREDPNPERRGPAKNVATKKKSNENVAVGGNVFAPGIKNTPAYKAGFATGKLPVPYPEGTQEYAAYYKGVIDKATPTLNKGMVEGDDVSQWRVEKSDATGRYHVVTGYTSKTRRVWKNKLGAVDFVKKSDAEAKANELNQGMAEGIFGDDLWIKQTNAVNDIRSVHGPDLDRDTFGEHLWNYLDQEYGPKVARAAMDDMDLLWAEYTDPTDKIAEEQLDEKCWPGYEKKGMKTMFGKRYPNCVKKEDIEKELCPECGGPMFSELLINEKKDACYYKVKSRYKVWPSAYASGALVQCRKKGASNWGTKSESLEEDSNKIAGRYDPVEFDEKIKKLKDKAETNPKDLTDFARRFREAMKRAEEEENKKTDEGLLGALAGVATRAALPKIPLGPIAAASLGSQVQDALTNETTPPGKPGDYLDADDKVTTGHILGNKLQNQKGLQGKLVGESDDVLDRGKKLSGL